MQRSPTFFKYRGRHKEVYRAIEDTWDNAIETVSSSKTSVRDEIKEQAVAFGEGIDKLVSFAKETLKKSGESGVRILKDFTKTVVQGVWAYQSAQLSVDLSRLSDLQSRMKNIEQYFKERIDAIVKEARKVTSDVGRNYKEAYVQREIAAINRTCDEIASNRKLRDMLERKIKALKYTIDHYQQVEQMIISL